jgi:excisionase family DNA binding protein
LKSRVAVTPKEYAQIYRCSEGLVYKAIRDGEIKSIRVGNKIAIPTGPILAELGIE